MNRRELIGALSSLSLSGSTTTAAATDDLIAIESPDKNIRLEFGLFEKSGRQSVACYSVLFRAKPLIRQSSLGMQLAPGGFFGSDLRIAHVARRQRDETYRLFPGKTSSARDHYSEAVVSLEKVNEPPQNVAPMTMGTRAHELARYVVYEGYLPMTVDYPDDYRNQPGLTLLSQVPTSWDETKVLNAAVDKYITVARHHGTQWYAGSMTNSSARELAIPLGFAGPGPFMAEIYSDDTGAPEHPERLVMKRIQMSGSQIIHARLAPAGGHVVRLTPLQKTA